MALSTAIGTERRTRTRGIKIRKGNFSETTPNLPQKIAIFGEANTVNQVGLTTEKKVITSAAEAGEMYGYGSPIHQQMRILRPLSGDGVGGIPTVVFPQLSDVSATPTVDEWTIGGTATANATHTGVINGRRSLDFKNYSYSIVIGDTATVIAGKIKDAINGVLSSPVLASNVGGNLTITTKYAGATSAELKTRFDSNNVDAGITYVKTSTVAGGGSVDLAESFLQISENEWYTLGCHSYGADATILNAMEVFNGRPDDETPTGRYDGRIMRPFAAIAFGSTLDDKDDLLAITDVQARINQNTNVLSAAPKSEGFSGEAAANTIALMARVAQNTPELDVNAKYYPDMPVPENGIIGDMAFLNNRDLLVKGGCSTVTLENGAYKIQDYVTTYHLEGESPLQYAYVRNLMLDFNIVYSYRILEALHVLDHVILNDGEVTDVLKSVKPKQWMAVLFDFFDDLVARGLIADAEFSKNSLMVEKSDVNPDRFETFFRSKRTSIARISSTDVEMGFNN